jgi:ferritin-like metal-binding protein YciE
MALDTLSDVVEDQIKDLYSAENQLAKALTKMAKAASAPELKEAFTTHLEQTKEQIERIKQIGEGVGLKKLGGKKCLAMEGLIKEGQECMEEDGEEACLDLALIAAAQRVEHYEISAYGTLKALLKQAGYRELVALADQTLSEEVATDKLLTKVTSSVIKNAPTGEEDEGDEDEE